MQELLIIHKTRKVFKNKAAMYDILKNVKIRYCIGTGNLTTSEDII